MNDVHSINDHPIWK